MILKNNGQLKLVNIHLLVIHCLRAIYLIEMKIGSIGIECEDCMKLFCEDLKKHVTRMISYEKKRNDTINKKGKEKT